MYHFTLHAYYSCVLHTFKFLLDLHVMSGHNSSLAETFNATSLLNYATSTSGIQAIEQQWGAGDSIAANAQTSWHQDIVS